MVKMDNKELIKTEMQDNKELANNNENHTQLAKPIEKPTSLSIEIYTKSIDGATDKELAVEYGIVESAVRYHLTRCRKFFGPVWHNYAETKAKMLLDKALKSTEINLDDNKEATTINYMNKMAYPDRSAKQTAIQLNINQVVNDMSGQARFDSNVEVIDCDVDNTETDSGE